MHTFFDPPVVRRKPTFQGFSFPSQIAGLMLVETEDLLPLIASKFWPIFGVLMALRYPTHPLKVAANAHANSILQFVSSDNSRRAPTYQAISHNFANLQRPMAYTIIKDRTQEEQVDKA